MISEKQAEYIKSLVSNLENAPYLKTATDSNKKRWMEDVMRLPTHDEDDNAIRRTLEEVKTEYSNRCNAIITNIAAMNTKDASKLIDALKSKFLPA